MLWWLLLAGHLLALYWPRIDLPGATPSGSDKFAHVLLFALPTIAALLALRRPWPVVTALAVHAPLSEWLQASVLPHRSGDPADAAADLLGVLVGAGVGWWLRARGPAAAR